MKWGFLQKLALFVLSIAVSGIFSVQPTYAANNCETFSDAVLAAEGTVAGLMAAASAADAAVAEARARLNSARLPAQRVSAQVTLLREEKAATKARSSLTTARNVLRAAKVSLSQCK